MDRNMQLTFHTSIMNKYCSKPKKYIIGKKIVSDVKHGSVLTWGLSSFHPMIILLSRRILAVQYL